MVRAQEGEQKQKAADLFLAAFLLRPLEGREEPNEALKRPKFIRWMNFSERRDDALALMIKRLYYYSVAVFLFKLIELIDDTFNCFY